jgi:hypothetical protein
MLQGTNIPEVQTVTTAASDTIGGTFILSFGGESTPALNATTLTDAELKSSLESLSSIEGLVSVTSTVSGNGSVYSVSFDGDKGDLALLSADYALLTEGQNVPEVQTLTTSHSGVMAGTFTLNFLGHSTGNLTYNAGAADVQNALDALPSIASVSVTRGAAHNNGYPYSITFDSQKGDMITIQVYTSNLQGDANIVETTKGVSNAGGFVIISEVTAGISNVGGSVVVAEQTKGVTDMGGLATVTELAKGVASKEVQVVTTTGSAALGGYFQLAFNGKTTTPLNPATLTGQDLADALDLLVTVVSGTTVNRTANTQNGFVYSITFQNAGNLPLLTADTTALTEGGANGGSVTVTEFAPGADVTVAMRRSGAISTMQNTDSEYPGASTIPSMDGSRENIECSGRGSCDRQTGRCACNSEFASSDGQGGVAVSDGGLFLQATRGTRGDCGYNQTAVYRCPVVPGAEDKICSGHGTCLGSPTYICECYNGYEGYACANRICPKGTAWFDEPYAPNQAHQLAVCSNRGVCNTGTGLCECDSGFSGESCQRLSCGQQGSDCNGHGQCRSIAQWAKSAMDNEGKNLGFTYGELGSSNTWDKNSIYGCKCDSLSYFGPLPGDDNGYTGFSCLLARCPHGDDPITEKQHHETQTLECHANSGRFSLEFKGVSTSPIAWNAVAMISDETKGSTAAGYGEGESLQAKLQAIETIKAIYYKGIEVVYSRGKSLCTETFQVKEIQTITSYGANTLGGTFNISFADETAGNLDPSTLTAGELTTALEAFSGIGDVTVTRSGELHTYEVQTLISSGNAAGTFTLSFQGQTTGDLAADLSGNDLKTALDALTTINQVTVTRTILNDGHEWSITFSTVGDRPLLTSGIASLSAGSVTIVEAVKGIPHYGYTYSITFMPTDGGTMGSPGLDHGDMDLFKANAVSLTQGTNVYEIQTITTSGSGALGGTVVFTFATASTGALSVDDLTAAQLQTSLNALPTIDQVTVTRGALANNGYDYVVAFSGASKGDVALIQYDTSSMTQGANTPEVQKITTAGAGTLGGTFTVAFLSETTAALNSTTLSAAELKTALEALIGISSVTVTRGALTNNGYEYTIQFDTEKGDLPMLVTDVSRMTQGGVAGGTAIVTETTSGVSNAGGTIQVVETTKGVSDQGATITVVETQKGVLNGTNYVDITFIHNLGDPPMLQPVDVNLADPDASLDADPDVTLGVHVWERRKGTYENAECSDKGICDRSTGRCKCFKGFTSSNGKGGGGARGDCGHLNLNQHIEGYPNY